MISHFVDLFVLSARVRHDSEEGHRREVTPLISGKRSAGNLKAFDDQFKLRVSG
jgi:hypothetical protein